MTELPPNKISTMASLFDNDIPNSPVLFSVIEGNACGRAMVNDAENPAQCAIISDYGFAFASTLCDDTFLASIVPNLVRSTPVFFVWPMNKPARWAGSDDVVQRIVRLEFRGGNRVTHGDDEFLTIPPGLRIARMDEAILDHCIWRNQAVTAHRSTEAFLKRCFGLCLLQGEVIAAEAYAIFWGAGRVEVGAITHPDFRKRGLAKVVCTHLIRKCEEMGFETVWSCHSFNSKSVGLARALGYRSERQYEFIVFKPGMCQPF